MDVQPYEAGKKQKCVEAKGKQNTASAHVRYECSCFLHAVGKQGIKTHVSFTMMNTCRR